MVVIICLRVTGTFSFFFLPGLPAIASLMNLSTDADLGRCAAVGPPAGAAFVVVVVVVRPATGPVACATFPFGEVLISVPQARRLDLANIIRQVYFAAGGSSSRPVPEKYLFVAV